MTPDPFFLGMAQAWLYPKQWTHTGDAVKLAWKLQETCEEYVKELEEAYEKDCRRN